MWLVRSYLYLALAGVDKAQMFMLADITDDSPYKFATSGIHTKLSDRPPDIN